MYPGSSASEIWATCFILTREAGEGDHPELAKPAEDGGGGAGIDETLSLKVKL
jgi:hypothetical protein